MDSLEKLCLHTITTKPWPIETAARKFRAAGITGISVWREAIINRDPSHVGRILKEEGMEVVSLVRGGFFPDRDASKRRDAIDQNKRALEEAAALSAPLLVLVCGADPRQSLEDSREQIYEGIAALLPMASDLGINLAEKAESDQVGVVVDVYHLWWDPDLEKEIQRCAQLGKLFAFHICDWKVPTKDFLNDREIMGRGCIPLSRIRKWVEAAGFNGYKEVEIFSNHYWQMDQDQYLKEIIEAYKHNS